MSEIKKLDRSDGQKRGLGAKLATAFYCLVVFGGAFLWVLLQLVVLSEGVHGLGHLDRGYSLPAKLLNDGTPLPFDLAAWATLTWLLVAWMKTRYSGDQERPVTVVSRTFPVFFAAAAVPMLLAACWLALSDFAFIPDKDPEALEAAQLIAWMSVTALVAQVSVAALAKRFRRVAAVLFPVLPIIALVPALIAGWEATARYAEIDALPSIYPTAGMVLSTLGLAALVGGTATALAWRACDKRTPLAAIGLPVGILANVICAALAFGLVVPFHHLCLSFAHAPVQRTARILIAFAFLVGWLAIGTYAFVRRRRSGGAGL